ncbi:MAG: PilZ domain-containing protein [Gammaproteobacteria bacterium]
MSEKTGAERRQDFRVQDQILLDYEVVSDTEMRGALKNIVLVDSAEMNATTTLRRLESDFQGALDVLQKNDKDLAKCLDLINNKLNTLTSLVPAAVEVDTAIKTREVRNCSLSASGIAFACKEQIPMGTNLCLRMVVLPNYHHVVAYGQVIRVTDIEDAYDGYSHIIGVHFEHILDRYREVLARRALQREIEDLRLKRREQAAEEENRSVTG